MDNQPNIFRENETTVGWISSNNLHSGRGGVFFLTSLFIELIDTEKGEVKAQACLKPVYVLLRFVQRKTLTQAGLSLQPDAGRFSKQPPELSCGCGVMLRWLPKFTKIFSALLSKVLH